MVASEAQVYIDENGRIDSVTIRLDVNGEATLIEFGADESTLFVLHPEDAGTIHDEFVEVESVMIRPRSDG